MIECTDFYKSLVKNRIEYFCGVPDSLLKNICAYIADNSPAGRHVIAANEGAAAAMAAGWYLGTGEPALVYMQNSGIGNAFNPLVSLADPAVYGIPMLLLIGWRGEPGVKDEPQHVRQGELTLPVLEMLGIPYTLIESSTGAIDDIVADAAQKAKALEKPYAIVAGKNAFSAYNAANNSATNNSAVKNKKDETLLSREEAVMLAAELAGIDSAIVSTTGMISRELFLYRERCKTSHESDFLTVGSMGHSSQIAFGLASALPEKKIYCFDGDGAVIMHMGSLAVNGTKAPPNLVHIVFNNEAHDSVGGQPTAAGEIDLPAVARACGYGIVLEAKTKDEIKNAFTNSKSQKGPAFIEIRVRKGARSNLGRPTLTPQQQKREFMEHFQK